MVEFIEWSIGRLSFTENVFVSCKYVMDIIIITIKLILMFQLRFCLFL